MPTFKTRHFLGCLAFLLLGLASCSRHGFTPPCESDDDCSGGDLCAGFERCEDTKCVPGEPLVCDDGLYCNGLETCDVQVGCVSDGAPCPGPDGDADCLESCDEAAGDCAGADPDGTACVDDGLYCTGSESCQAGSCSSAGNPCPSPDDCNEDTDMCADCGDGLVGNGEDCDSTAGDHCCHPAGCIFMPAGQPDPQGICSGAPECRLDVCDGTGGCAEIDAADGNACTDDMLFCTGAETCQAGICRSAGNPCPGADADSDCSESCDETAAACSGPDPDGTSCDDGQYCTGSEECQAGACQSGGNPCPGPDGDADCAESCDEAGDSCTGPDPVGASCDDGLYCTGPDECQAGVCQSGDDPCPGPDGDSNCSESCNEAEDSCSEPDPDGIACADDGQYCNGSEECQAGACLGDGDPCPGSDQDGNCSESCDESGDNCTAPDPGDTLCDDGEYCNGDDLCDAIGSCSQHSGDPCGGPACDEDQNVCLDEPWFDLGGSDFGPWSGQIGGGSFWGGGISGTARPSLFPSMALDSLGYPLIAWQDSIPGSTQIYVRGYDPAGLSVELGAGSASGTGMSSTAGQSWQPALALDSAYLPVVAWQDDSSGNFEIYVRRFDGIQWIPVGAGSDTGAGISNSLGASQAPTLALDQNDNPVVAWQDDSSANTEIYVKRYDGGSWVDVGAGSSSGAGISANAGESLSPALVLDDLDNPLVAWHDDSSGDSEIYLKAFDGAAWQDLGPGSSSAGGISDNAGASSYPVLALDAAFNPVVAWQDDSPGNHEIYAKRFDGLNWVDAGTGSSSGGGISSNAGASEYPWLTMDAAFNPVVAWHDDSAGLSEILAARLEGGNWVDVLPGSSSGAGVSSTTGTSLNPVMAFDQNDDPVAVWHDTTSGNFEIYARRSDGSAWVDVGAGSQVGGALSDNAGVSVVPFVVQDSAGNPVVSWHDESPGNFEIYITGYDGSSWAQFGPNSASGAGISGNAGKSFYSSLALAADNHPLVAWQDETPGPTQIYVREFSDLTQTWNEVGAGSASGGGISNNVGWSMNPSMALDDQDRPVVAWHDGTSGTLEIYVKRYDGVGWVEVGAGSASGGGISSTGGDSKSPWLALDDQGYPVVAWYDDTSGNQEIYVKWFDGGGSGTWVELEAGSASAGGISANPGGSSFPKLAMDGSDNPVVAWADNSPGATEIYVKKFDGLNWVEVGPGSASGLGISGNPGNSARPSLAIDALGNPVVSWHDEASGRYEIYLKRFDGAVPGAWEEVGGSASAGGISNSAAQSGNSSVSVRGTRTCVAWHEPGMDSLEIILRCSDE